MPIPVIIWAIGVGVTALLGIGTVAFWDEIINFFKGKRIAILGAKSTGKTTLHNFLTNGELKGGTGIEDTKSNVLKLNDLKFYIKSFKDITGSEDFVNVWADFIKDSDFTFYMIDSSKIFNNDYSYIKLVEKQLSLIGDCYEKLKRNDKVSIICVFSDKVQKFIDNKEQFEQQMKTLLARASLHVNSFIFVGSLVNDDYKQKLVYDLLNTIKSK